MNGKAGGTGGPWRAGALAVVAAVAVLATACGGSSAPSSTSASAGSATFAQVVALAGPFHMTGRWPASAPGVGCGWGISAGRDVADVALDAFRAYTDRAWVKESIRRWPARK